MIDLKRLKTFSIRERSSKVDLAMFARPNKAGVSFKTFIRSLPNLLRSSDLSYVVTAIVRARNKGKPVVLMMGAHVIKCGLSPWVIEMIRRNVVTAVAMNGAGIVHDFEIAFGGKTSEDVGAALDDGSFGMARETGEFLNNAVKEGVRNGFGLGASVGRAIERAPLKFKKLSVASACAKAGIPLTVHVAIGTDIIHPHPSFDGAATGEASARDFRRLIEVVTHLDGGGVVLNFGSAVIMPEVFLKALSAARNLTGKVKGFTTANFDMNAQYRPLQNIVLRPTQKSGRGVSIIGHHEIMMPLLFQAVTERLGR
jgi:hypothetical protein